MNQAKEYSFPENSFSFIRLLCCLCIMFSHYCVFTVGIQNVYKPALFAGSSLCVFFMLSGFLVGPSVLRHSPKQFIKKRVLRLYPVYVVSLIVTVILASLTNLINVNGGDSLTVWCLRNLIFFEGSELNGISNGAIWAIFIQVQVYIATLLTYKHLNRINSIWVWLLFLFALLILNCNTANIESFLDGHNCHVIWILYSRSFLPYAYFFFIGMFAYKFFGVVVPTLARWWYLFLFLHLLWHMGFVEFPSGFRYTDPVTVLTASAAAIGFAYRYSKIKIKHDFSYDIFVWHMPVITCLYTFGIDKSFMLFVSAICLTTIVSLLTHYLIELRFNKIFIK